MAGLINGAVKQDDPTDPTKPLDAGALDGTIVAPKSMDTSGLLGSAVTPAPAAPQSAGLIAGADNVTGVQTQDVTQTGYIPAAAPVAKGADATGYTAASYTPEQQTESTSQALDRILKADSPYIERAKAGAAGTANSRGLLNSSIAAGAGESAAIGAALPVAQGDVQVGMFNVQQANDAKAKATDATNQASAMLANATNLAKQFTAGEENKTAMFAVEQANLASRYAADAANAAAQFNAGAHNTAMQNYANAINASRMAIQELQSRAQIAQLDAGARIGAANIGANAQIETTKLQTQNQAAIAAGEWQNRLDVAGLDAATRTHLAQLGIDADAQRNLANLNQNTLVNVGGQLAAIQSNPNMSTDDKATAIRNLLALYSGSPYLPASINWGGAPNPNANTGAGNPAARVGGNPTGGGAPPSGGGDGG